ncbi:hypothetical protein INS49_008918 [Diaporthe citri]|uniref:uncharacterized protein n=1 Tax=Diaporthe citri TaxID=83186 RepID=UPI001C7E9B47|nr:uncharacterized protein INS49_008918 [Diaporthe citri]KAG6363815.1 hypothetical protein INS49_008918 [Diaporthe citri]
MAANTRHHLKLSLPRPEFLQHKKSQRLPPTPEEGEEFQFEAHEGGDSAEDATEWIKSTIREQGRWERHMSLIRIDCPHTMTELRQLGRLSKSDGTRQCRKMIRIPVLYDEIGCFLWEKLAALERGPDFGREDEERAADYARGVTYRTRMAALDERFRFDAPASTSASSGTTARRGRARQDSEPISPKHIQQAQAELSDVSGPITTHQSRPNTSPTCHFCPSGSTREHPTIPTDITADALGATRGRVVDHQTPSSRGGQVQTRLSRSASQSSSRTRRPSAFFNYSRSSSHTSTLHWRHDRQGSTVSCSAGANGRSASASSGSGSAQGGRSRDASLSGRVGCVVGNLGREVVVAIGGGLAHGYGYGGRADRNGSFRSV